MPICIRTNAGEVDLSIGPNLNNPSGIPRSTDFYAGVLYSVL